MLMKVEAGFEHYSKNPYIYTRSMNLKQNAMNRVCITLLLCCLSSCRMNKTERMEMSEDSIDTVRIDQGVGKKQ